MSKSDQIQNENISKGNSEDSLLVIYILRILKKYSSHKNPLSSQDVMDYLRKDYSIGRLDKAEIQRKKVRRHLDTLHESYPDGCIKKKEGKTTREGHKWYYDASRDRFADKEAVIKETLTDAEIDFIVDIIASSKIINSSSTISIVNKLLKKTKLSKEARFARLRKIKNEEWPKSINKELLLIKKEIQSCIDDVRKMRFDYEDEKSILVTPYGWGADENGKYILIAKVDGEPEGEFSSYSLEKIHNIKKEDFNYSDFDDTYFDRSYGRPDDLSTESLFSNIQTITAAIEEKNGIEFKYLSYVIRDSRVVVDGKERRVLPHRLVFNDGKYYLIGYDEEQAKIDYYRVDLISKLSYSNTKIEISDWDARVLSGVQRAREIEKHPLMLAGTDIPVTFKVVESALDRVIDAFGKKADELEVTDETRVIFNGQIKDNIIGNKSIGESNAERVVKVKVRTTIDEAFRWSLANADVVELVSPYYLRYKLRRIAAPLQKLYVKTMDDQVRENVDRICESGIFNLVRYKEELPIYNDGTFFSTPFHIGEDLAYESYKVLRDEGKLDVVNNITIWHNNADRADYLGDFGNAIYLDIANSECKDPEWISNLTGLLGINISSTKIESVSWLKDIKKLQGLALQQSPVSDLSVLKDNEDIMLLKLIDISISDIEFIDNYRNLQHLTIIGCPVKDYSPLLRIPPLMHLEVDERAVEALGMEALVKHHPNANIVVQQRVDNRKE